MNRRLLLFLFLFPGTMTVWAQTNLPQVIPPSPNAASLGIYGQIPVSLFSGLPQISIPLGNVTAGDISVPISLNYHGGGVQPDLHPGWVGLGWDLKAGGVITRKVNGGPDEILSDDVSPTTLFGYYYNYFDADFPNWASADTLNYYRLEPNPHAYPSPDEFMFNFGGYSGSFFYNQKGEWQVKSADPVNIKVEEELTDDYSLPVQPHGNSDLIIKRIFYKFTLTTPDGTKYIFGGTPESIEFSRNSIIHETVDTYNINVIATSWYLTSIISRNGQRIDLNYVRDGIQAHQFLNLSRYSYMDGQNETSNNVSIIYDNTANVINPSYLTAIKAPNQTITFARSQSGELSYDYNIPDDLGTVYQDLSELSSFSDIERDVKWLKLDSISFYSDSAGCLKKYAFYYRNDTARRLTLDSLKEVGAKGNSISPYQFFYDEATLPPYNSREIDHWGYYNGHDYFTDVPKEPSEYDSSDITAYFASRNSDTSLVRAGILIKIKYPTGGTTSFIYEPHSFSKVAKRYPFVVADSAGSAGGVRISKIINRDEDGNISGVKQYLYVRNYNSGGTTSSGVLAGVPQYFDQGQWTFTGGGGTLSYWNWYDVAITPLSLTDGNHVTYSEVVEKLQDGSYTIYNYSNHDAQSYRDELPVFGQYSLPGLWRFDPATSRSLERGKLLSRKDYNASNVLLHAVKYDYDTSASRYSEAVRMVSLSFRYFGNKTDGRATAYLIYTFPHYLIRETDTLWDQNGTNPLVTVKNTVYNTDYRQKTIDSTFTSEGKSEKFTYLYPFDLLSGSEAAIYQKMTDSNFIAPVIQSRKFIDTTQANYTNTHYYEPFAGIYTPGYVDGQIGNNPIDTSLQFSNYDNKGNILEYIPRNGIPTSFDWGYNQEYPIAKVVNAHNTIRHFTIPVTSWAGDVLTWVSGATDQKSITITSMAAGNISVEGHYNSLPDGKTYSFNYSLSGPVNESGNLCASGCGDPSSATFTGMPAGTYTLYVTPSSNGPASLFFMISYPITVDSPATSGEKNYFYDGFEENDDAHVVNGQAHTGNRYWSNNTYTTSFIPPDNGTYRIEWWSLSGGSWRYNQQQYSSGMILTGPVDDVRICPANALMSTYTYQPMVGMTSEIDPKGFTTYYSYDPLGRLTLVRDKDNNIIKRFCYNLAGQQQSCPFTK